MAGSIVVLHNQDNAPNAVKDITRNLGLQSVVYNEATSAGLAISKAKTIEDLTNQLSTILASLSLELEEYIEATNRIYYLLQNAYYTNSTRTNRFTKLQNEAKKYF